MNPLNERRPGRILTFYSYKGGTGRSMALANVAWILASAGRRVLAIDWDLEAPGLQRYYHPFLSDPELTQNEGLMDFFLDFASAAQIKGTGSVEKWFEPYANLTQYTVPIQWGFPGDGALHLVPAGRQDGGYATRVTGFNWQSFYSELGGGVFLEAVKRRLRAEYDYILIDSRTGLSDTSGICSVQMPDDLVCCFTLNSQSISGAGAAADSAFQQRLKPSGEPGLRVWPVPTRVELHERDRLDMARATARARFAKFLTHVPRAFRSSYMDSVEVLYQPYFAYEEVLATLADRRNQTGSLLGSFEQICRWVTDGDVIQLSSIAESQRLESLARFTLRSGFQRPKVYVPINITAEDAKKLSTMSLFMPDWYLKGAASIGEWLSLGPSRALKAFREFMGLLTRHFGECNVFVRSDVVDLIRKLMAVNVSGGSIAEVDVVLITDEMIEGAAGKEIEWALANDIPIIPVRLHNVDPEKPRKIPKEFHSAFRRGLLALVEDDL